MNGNDRLKDELRKRNNERLRESMFQGDRLKKSDVDAHVNNQSASETMTLNDLNFNDSKLDLKLDSQNININLKDNNLNNTANLSDSSVENLSMDDVSDKTEEASNDTKKTAQDTSKSERLQNNDEETLNAGEDSVTEAEPEKKDEDSEKKDEDSEKKDEDSEKKDEDSEKKGEDSEKKDEGSEKKDDTEEKDKSGESGDLENNADASKKEEEANEAAQKEQQEKEQQEEKDKEKQEKKDKKEEEKQKQEKKDKDSKGNDSKENDKNDQKGKNAPPANNSKAGDKPQQKSGDKSRQKPGDRIRNSAQNKKNELTNKLKNPKKTLKDGIKNKATKSFNNSGVGKAVQKGKQTVENVKKTVKAVKNAAKAIQFLLSTIHIWGPVVGVILLILLIAAVIVMLLPGNGGDVNEKNADYSETDQKTLEKMEKIFDKYPNADGTLGMAIVVYPYFANLHDGNVESYLTGSSDSSSEDDSDEEEDLEEEENDDNEDVENDKNEVEDDMYLIPFRNSKVRKRLKKVLKNIENASEDDVKQYLIDDYFKKDKGFSIGYDKDILTGYNGYKKLFKALDDDDKRERLEELIIKDLYDIKDMFVNYVYKSMSCTTSAQSIGYFDSSGILNGEAVIILKDTGEANFSSIKAANSLYGTDDLHLDLKRYVLGVVYAEIGDVSNEALVKADMIAAKSFVLGRTAPGSTKTVGMGYEYEQKDGKTIFYMRGNTYDQDFCDVYEGCRDGSKYAKNLITNDPTGEATTNKKPALSSDVLSKLEKWYDDTASEFVYDEENSAFHGRQLNDYGGECKAGSCLSQEKAKQDANSGMDYKTILFSSAYSESRYTLYNTETQNISAVSSVCTNRGAICGVSDSDFIYYSQKVGIYSNEIFCNRTDGTTFKQAACGVTSMAMIIANLADPSVTPLVTNQEAYEGGYCGNGISGTSAGYFSAAASKYGLTITERVKTNSTNIASSAEEIINTLRNGGLAIINVNASWLNGSSGHYLVVKGVDNNNNLIIADPYADSLTTPVRNNVSAEDIIENYVNNDHGWYLFTSDKSAEIVEKYCSNGKATGYLGNPVDPNDITRDFMNAGNSACYPKYCDGSSHGGVDFNSSDSVNNGDPVYAMDGGTVSDATSYSENCYHSLGYAVCYKVGGYGISVTIDHGNGYKTVYGHLSNRVVEKDELVAKGQLIGYVGNTGNSSGPHLHLELQNSSLLAINGRTGARGYDNKGLMNVSRYINKNATYVGEIR